MNLIMRLATILFVLCFVAACKIQVIAPEYGDVQTQSGSFLCEAGNTCIIDVSDLEYDEVFIVKPQNGYVFDHWKNEQGYLCSGPLSCHLYTSGFEGNDRLLEILFSDEHMYTLEPVFKTSELTDHFVTIWRTDERVLAGSNKTSITIETRYLADYNYDVDWNGDGIFDDFGITGDAEHDYGVPGTYTVRIKGTFSRYLTFQDSNKILSIEQWGAISWAGMEDAFARAQNLVMNAQDTPDLSRVKSIHNMFYQCSSLGTGLGNWYWDTSNVEDMSSAFWGATSFNKYIGDWDVSNVTDMDGMFADAIVFNRDIGNWDTSKVTTMGVMFLRSEGFNQDIGRWDVSNVTSLGSMFQGASNFNQDIGNWDTSNTVYIGGMFRWATDFNQDIGSWDLGRAKQTIFMFDSASSFNQDISGWNTSSVESMAFMFRGATMFDQNIGNWDICVFPPTVNT